MTSKYQRPAGAFAGASGLANRTKYQDDATATPKRAVSSAKVDGDINYVIESLNLMDEASGTRASINERLDVSLNADGSLKVSVAGAMDEWIVHTNPGTISRIDTYTIGITGDWRTTYTVNRRIRLTMSGVAFVGDVYSVAYVAGVTQVSVVDLYDAGGNLALVSSVPTQLAYGPLTTGLRGNTPRRVDGVRIPVGSVTVELKADDEDMVFTYGGLPVAAVTENGLAGYAPGSVDAVALADAVISQLVPAGAVMPYAGSAAPNGWLMCYGQAVSRTTYAALYAKIGTAHGTGNGTTTFNLPDMRGRTVFGLDNMGGTDAGRLSVANTLGLAGGSETKTSSTASYTLTVADIPAHSHDANAVYGAAGNNPSGGAVTYDSSTAGSRLVTKTTGGGGGHSHAITGLDVMPPYLLMNHIIKV